MPTEAQSPSEGCVWELWRQDDNGVRALMARFLNEEEALSALARFEAHHHKQTYWIEHKRTSQFEQF